MTECLLNDTRSKHSCVAASPGLDPKLRDLRDGSAISTTTALSR
jgi:hypothetical protein